METAISRIAEAKKNKSRCLNLSYLGLEKIPLDISDMYYLLDIDISNNKFKSFPSEISKLENLQNIDVSNNSILEIQLEEGKHYSLLELNISSNLLNRIPNEIKYL